MGAGVVNAFAFLNKIAGDGAGVAMEFPNVYINAGASATVASATVAPSAFLEGESFSVTVDDPSVATVSADGLASSASASVSGVTGNLTFFGLKSGSTTATITTSGGVQQTFAITVRTSEGWL